LSHELTLKLLVIISCFAALTFVGSRKWLRPTETVILGIAMIFWATGWLMETLVRLTEVLYGSGPRPVLIAITMTLPMTLSMSVGLWFLIRRMKRNESLPPVAPSPARRRKQKKR